MAFQQGLSGLNASARNLDVIGHNIANANTTGMKAGRAEFSEIYASAIGLSGAGAPGLGVSVATVSQQFTQGNITTTSNSLDVAINGNGFYQLEQQDGSLGYTRAGNFKLNKDGNLVTNQNAKVMGYPVDPQTGVITSVTTMPMSLPTGGPINAKQTSEIAAEFNLDARTKLAAGSPAVAGPPAVAAVPASLRTTYGTTVSVFDAQGVPTPVNLYFEKQAAPNTWKVFDTLDTVAQPSSGTGVGTITFDSAGNVSSATPAPGGTFTGIGLTLSVTPTSNPNAPLSSVPSAPFPVNLRLDKITQFGNPFSVSSLSQDGYASGELTGVNIEVDGMVTARYSNGVTQSAGRIALVNFRNPQGLSPLSGSVWTQTFASGDPVLGMPGNGNFGELKAGALEDSNVDLTAELVNMMTAQRSYQANAQTIKTQDQVLSTLVNLR